LFKNVRNCIPKGRKFTNYEQLFNWLNDAVKKDISNFDKEVR